MGSYDIKDANRTSDQIADPAGIRLPGNGLAKAQGLYQCSLVLVVVAQVVPGLEGSGLPPNAKGLEP